MVLYSKIISETNKSTTFVKTKILKSHKNNLQIHGVPQGFFFSIVLHFLFEIKAK